MNELTAEILELWSRWNDNEPLSAEEQQRLGQALSERPELRAQLHTDAMMHALLLSLPEASTSDEAFVASVLARCNLAPSSSSPESPTTKPVELEQREQSSTGSVTQSDSVTKPSPVTPNRRPARLLSHRFYQLLAVAATLLIAVGWLTWKVGLVGPNQNQVGDKRPKSSPDQPAVANNQSPGKEVILSRGQQTGTQPQGVPVQFVTLTNLDKPVWERERAIGDRLGPETIRLFGGTVQLTFDNGAVLNIEGPVEFQPLAAGELQLRRGRLSATVPTQAVGFKISTPTSKVVDLGTEFDVMVKDTGATDVHVSKGEVEVTPNQPTGETISKWRLLPSGLDRASFDAPLDDTNASPVSATAHGAKGKFVGVISVNGRTMEFASEQAFDNVHEHVIASFVKSREEMLKQWKEFADTWDDKHIQGTMNVNGVQMPFGSIREVLSLPEMLDKSLKDAANENSKAGQQTTFVGSININGKVRTFSSRAEYEAARNEAFGPAANFGVGLFPRLEE